MTAARNDKVPIVRCIQDSFQFLRDEWVRFLPSAIIISLISTATAALAATPLLEMAFAIVNILAGIAFAAAVLRKSLFDTFAGPIGLRLGLEEFRLLGVAAAIALLLLPAMFLLSVVGVSILVSRLGLTEQQLQAMTEDPEKLREALLASLAPTDILLALVFLLPVLWLAAKLFLANPATIGEHRTFILQTWKWSAGNAWRIVGAMIVTAAPMIAFGVIALMLIASVSSTLPWVTLMMFAVIGVVSAVLRIPLIALSAILYRGLRPQ